jgi:hypothetical protein
VLVIVLDLLAVNSSRAGTVASARELVMTPNAVELLAFCGRRASVEVSLYSNGGPV